MYRRGFYGGQSGKAGAFYDFSTAAQPEVDASGDALFHECACVVVYRLTGGKAQMAKYPTMLMTVKGRKTGKLRTIPLVYVKDGENFVIAAAYAGSESNPTWWLNLQASGEAVVQEMRNTVRVRAEVAPAQERAALWQRLAAMYPYFLEYQTRTTREIPVVILKPIADAGLH